MEHLKNLTDKQLVDLYRDLKDYKGILYSVDFVVSDPECLKDEVRKLLLERGLLDDFVKFANESPVTYVQGKNEIVDKTLEKVKGASKDEVFGIVDECMDKLTPNIKDARIIELL